MEKIKLASENTPDKIGLDFQGYDRPNYRCVYCGSKTDYGHMGYYCSQNCEGYQLEVAYYSEIHRAEEQLKQIKQKLKAHQEKAYEQPIIKRLQYLDEMWQIKQKYGIKEEEEH